MINWNQIKRDGMLISDDCYLSDDSNEENPVEVYFYDDTVFWCKYKDVNKVRAFVLTKGTSQLNKEHKDEILTSTLGKYDKKDTVTVRDAFLHGGYIQEVDLSIYDIHYNNGEILDKDNNSIVVLTHAPQASMMTVCDIFKHSLNLWAVDEYLLDCRHITQDDREIIVEALNTYLNERSNNLLLHAVLNQIETDFDDQDYESIDELLQRLIDIPQAKDLLTGYLSDTALENWKLGRTAKRY